MDPCNPFCDLSTIQAAARSQEWLKFAILLGLSRIANALEDGAYSTTTKSASLNHAAGTYDIFTATGGDILIKRITFFNDVAGVGLTSVSMSDNNSTPDLLLASTPVASLTGGVVLPAAQLTPFTLFSGNKIQETIVGPGSAGSIVVGVEYRPLTIGATLV